METIIDKYSKKIDLYKQIEVFILILAKNMTEKYPEYGLGFDLRTVRNFFKDKSITACDLNISVERLKLCLSEETLIQNIFYRGKDTYALSIRK